MHNVFQKLSNPWVNLYPYKSNEFGLTQPIYKRISKQTQVQDDSSKLVQPNQIVKSNYNHIRKQVWAAQVCFKEVKETDSWHRETKKKRKKKKRRRYYLIRL